MYSDVFRDGVRRQADSPRQFFDSYPETNMNFLSISHTPPFLTPFRKILKTSGPRASVLQCTIQYKFDKTTFKYFAIVRLFKERLNLFEFFSQVDVHIFSRGEVEAPKPDHTVEAAD